MCRYSPEQSMCSVRHSFLRVALGLALNSLIAVDFRHLQFEIISTTSSHLVKITVDLVVQALFVLILVCFIGTELLVLIVLGCTQHGSHELAFVL